MTATDELRRLLDERGVKWDYGITGATTTRFNANGVDLTFTPMRDGVVCSTVLTPEQAIAVTLGVGTCHMEYANEVPYAVLDSLGTFFCSECGSPIYNDMTPTYCPYCGAKVVNA